MPFLINLSVSLHSKHLAEAGDDSLKTLKWPKWKPVYLKINVPFAIQSKFSHNDKSWNGENG